MTVAFQSLQPVKLLLTRRERKLSCRRIVECQSSPLDAAKIQRCIDLARNAVGQTRPNPPVGCVITDANGNVLGEGYHKRAGTPHAEVNALADAQRKGNVVKDATAYVSLEPCNHFGRTPPCSRALVKAGVSRVVIGMVDPDPRTAGGGVQTLREAGIHVDVGVEEAAARQLAEGFVSRVLRKRPFGILKYAMTLDGKIASVTGSSKWVTGPAARSRVQAIRRGVDAIIVGGGTVRMDDPSLTVRENPGDLAPFRVVMTRSMDLPLTAKLWDTGVADTIIFAAAGHGRPDTVRELRAKGVTIEEVPGLQHDDVMQYLYERDCLSVLWESGGGLTAGAVKAGAVQKVHAFIAPKIIGGEGKSPVGNPAIGEEMSGALRLENQDVETFEDGDLLVTGNLYQRVVKQ